MNSRVEEIGKALADMLSTIKNERQYEYEELCWQRRNRDENAPPDWSTENASINSISIKCCQNYGTIDLGASCLNGNYDGYHETCSISAPLVCSNTKEYHMLLDTLKKKIEQMAAADNEYLFAPAIHFELAAYINKNEHFGETVITNKGYEIYLQSLRDFRSGIISGTMPFEDIQYFYFDSILYGLHYFIDEVGYAELKQLVTRIHEMSHKKFNGDSIRFTIQDFLKYGLCRNIERKTQYKLNEAEQDIFNYTADYLLLKGEKNESKRLYIISADCGNEEAREKLGRKKKKSTPKSGQEMWEEILQKYIASALNSKNVEDILPESFMEKNDNYRSEDEAIALNAIKYPDLHPLMREAVEALIVATKKGAKHLWEANGEEQMGGAVARELAMHYKADIKLYARYIATNDLDHPVYQYSDMLAVIEKWGLDADVYPLIVVNGLINAGQHGDELIDKLKDRLVAKLKEPGEANFFLAACAEAFIEGWRVHIDLPRRLEQINELFANIFDFSYTDGNQALSTMGFMVAVSNNKIPTYELLQSMNEGRFESYIEMLNSIGHK